MILYGVCMEKYFREEAKRIFDVEESSCFADLYVEEKMNESKFP